jgi:hypothetical protein
MMNIEWNAFTPGVALMGGALIAPPASRLNTSGRPR